MDANTRIVLDDLTSNHCRIFVDTYRAIGFGVVDNAMQPEHLASTLKERLRTSPFSEEFRPDGHSQNKLEVRLKGANDGGRYIHVVALPNEPGFEEGNYQQRYDTAIREIFDTI